jgi:hypothetical protein
MVLFAKEMACLQKESKKRNLYSKFGLLGRMFLVFLQQTLQILKAILTELDARISFLGQNVFTKACCGK